ncbi:MAG: DUF4338 domain-containing protein, partial [Sorangiineae bacterium PRO1]|nr:DUF4338 domain-containing protein [Sorangiineae bacterium PRO1]
MTNAQITADLPTVSIGGRGDALVVTRAPSETSFAAFVPRRVGVYFERFHELALRLGRADEARAAVHAIQREDEWAERQPGAPEVRDRYRAALAVLADLIGQGWVWRYREHHLELAPPDFTTTPTSAGEIATQKEAIRLSMASERLAELSKDSTRRFLAEMEQPREHKGSTHSILSLVTSGEALARDLRAVAQLEDGAREEGLDRVIQPYIQFVSEDQHCKLTGYRLIDVWRYFRYYWSLPYFSTPGRNLFYLVRDAARPLHPVIGIAALGNSMVRLGPREEWIGWTVESVASRVAALNESASPTAPREKETLARSLFAAIEQALTQVNPRGLVNAKELANPTEKTLLRLLDRARSSALDRVNKLRAHQQELERGGSSKRTRPLDPTQTMFASTKDRRELTEPKRWPEAPNLGRGLVLETRRMRSDGHFAADHRSARTLVAHEIRESVHEVDAAEAASRTRKRIAAHFSGFTFDIPQASGDDDFIVRQALPAGAAVYPILFDLFRDGAGLR